ncbi:MAG: class I SAM-dependent methyltransferase [Chitinophagaceae bacterium]|nr:class I SAM-dependent methyltransferase [Chitinophagaceae bacterium]
MYSKPRLAFKYLKYCLTAANGKGHGIHSPFVFDFVSRVLNDTRYFYSFSTIETQRELLLMNESTITVEDFGAGSTMTSSNQRRVKDIAKWSLKPPKYARLLFRMVNYFQPASIIELGTSLGITTAYLAMANPAIRVYTFEGAPAVAEWSQKIFQQLGIANIQQVQGNFDVSFQPFLQQKSKADFVFIDGNHREEPVVRYFEWLLPYTHGGTILVFDDIHWSSGMEAAWKKIIAHPAVTCTIDLFFIGIVFFNPDFKVKQDFVIRF